MQNAVQNSTWSLRDLSCPEHRRTLVFIRELLIFSEFSKQRHAELEPVFGEKVCVSQFVLINFYLGTTRSG